MNYTMKTYHIMAGNILRLKKITNKLFTKRNGGEKTTKINISKLRVNKKYTHKSHWLFFLLKISVRLHQHSNRLKYGFFWSFGLKVLFFLFRTMSIMGMNVKSC